MKVFLTVLLIITLIMSIVIPLGASRLTTTSPDTIYSSTPHIINVPARILCPLGQRKDFRGVCRKPL
ncbi:unnamed protein product [Lasius platythorax]|uniref:Uncharacterized protein n=1 Tax=Lasius platythorax TaxID=488582 RepID=A0AAV2P0Y9_9HYME